MVRRTKTTGNPNNPFRFKSGKNEGKSSGKRVGKSKPEKSNNGSADRWGWYKDKNPQIQE